MLKNYFTTALRNIKRHKGYSFINITGLAVGLACCMLIFLWVNHEWSYDRSHKNVDSIYRVVAFWPQGNDTGRTWRTQPPLAAALKEDIPEIHESTRFYRVSGILVEQEGIRFKETIGFTDPELFSIFTLPLRKGSPQAVLSDPQSIVMSATAAKKYFGDEDPLGKTIVLNDALSFRVQAVMEDIPVNSALHCPILIPFSHLEPLTGYGNVEDWEDFGFNTYVLLNNNANQESVDVKLKEYLDIRWDNPENDVSLALQPLTRMHLYALGGGGPIVYIWIFSAIAAFILLIACVNFMNLTTARSATRAREIGIRKVVGADRRRLIWQFLSESIFLSLIAFAFALVLVNLFERPLANLAGIPSDSQLLNPGIIPAFILITVVTGLIAGIYPAIFLSSFRPVEVLKGRRRTGSPFFRNALVVFQFTVSISLLIGMFLISKQIEFMSRKPLGFGKDNVVYIALNETLLQSIEPFRAELMQNPSIFQMTATSNYVGQGPQWSTSGVQWEGKDPTDGFSLSMIYADFDFADTFGLEIIEGRFFSREFESDATGFVLNETAVQGMGVEDPLGMELDIAGQSGRLIGILKDFHFSPLHDQVKPLVLLMEPQYYQYLAVKIVSENTPVTLGFLENKFNQFSPKYPFEYRFLDNVLDQEYKAEQQSQSLLRYFVLLAALISCLGLFGLASFMTERRTKEIGVRKVLGASEAGIFFLLSRYFVRWVLAANLLAWPIAYFGMNRWLQSFAYRTPIDWSSFVLAALLSLGVALLTVSWQSIKVAYANPATALRLE